MKLKISLVSLVLTFAAVTFAQPSGFRAYTTETAGFKNAFKYNSFKDNWFIQLGAGAQMLVAEDLRHQFFVPGQLTLAPTFAFGKWFNPWMAVRFKGEGGSIHSFPEWNIHEWIKPMDNNNAENIDFDFMMKNHYYAGHFDLMWNMFNWYGRYNSKRIFSLIPYVGLGAYYKEPLDQRLCPIHEGNLNISARTNPVEGRQAMHYNETVGVTVHGGFIFQFRLSNRIGFYVELAGLWTDDHFNSLLWDDNKWHTKYEGVVSTTAGFTFSLAKTYFEPIVPMDDNLIKELNDKINALRAENDELRNRPIPEPKEPVVAIVEDYFLSNVFFRLNRWVIDPNQQINVYNSAQFVKNTGKKIKVVGYADRQTGNPKINIWLGEQRAKSVAKELMSQYNIPSDMIIIEWRGDLEQPFPINNWNRVVIMTAAE